MIITETTTGVVRYHPNFIVVGSYRSACVGTGGKVEQNDLLSGVKLSELIACNFEGAETSISESVNILSEGFMRGGKIITCGNGGSMAQAMHLAGELAGRFRADRRPIPAVCISDPVYLTCVANDYGYENVFARWIEGFATPDDTVMLFTTSGLSPNIVQAAKAAKASMSKLIVFTGNNGSAFEHDADVIFKLNKKTTPDTTQHYHQMLLHTLTGQLEQRLKLDSGITH